MHYYRRNGMCQNCKDVCRNCGERKCEARGGKKPCITSTWSCGCGRVENRQHNERL